IRVSRLAGVFTGYGYQLCGRGRDGCKRVKTSAAPMNGAVAGRWHEKGPGGAGPSWAAAAGQVRAKLLRAFFSRFSAFFSFIVFAGFFFCSFFWFRPLLILSSSAHGGWAKAWPARQYAPDAGEWAGWGPGKRGSGRTLALLRHVLALAAGPAEIPDDRATDHP